MQSAMDRLDRFVKRRRWLVVGLWLLVLAGAAPLAARQTEELTSGGYGVPGSGSLAVDRQLDRFDGVRQEQLAVVLARRPDGDAEAMRRQIERVDDIAARLAHAELADPVEARARARADERVLVLPLEVTGDDDQAADLAVDLRDRLGVGQGPRAGIEPYLVGQQALWAGMQELTKEDLEQAELTGFPIVLLILLAVFGSLAAAALPLALGFASVVVTGAAIFFLSRVTDMSVFTTNIASMIGIGVAVDYSLFVLARYREEIRAGLEPDEARRVAMRTSGIAVAFSGVTVIVSLAGLFLIDSTTIRSMAMGAIVVVAVSIVAAVTLLPAVIRLLGRRAYARGRIATVTGLVARAVRARRRRPGASAAARPDFWHRWTERVMRRPALSALASAGVMLVLAVPTLSLEWGDGALRQFPEGHETRVGAQLAAQATGAGAAGPTQVLARLERGRAGDPANQRAVERYAAALRRQPEVAAVEPPRVSGDGRGVLFTLTSATDPESPATRALVDRLRAPDGPGAALRRVARIEVGGATAHLEDFKDQVSGSMWKILLFVALLSYAVLFVLLRSVLLPLKAVLMNLLSVAAAYGVLVAIFQYGWIDGFLGFQSLGYVNTLTPPFLLAIVFGLSMDYEVFLLSRIRERYDATGSTAKAVAQGLAASARTITSAALIMVAVFAVFAGIGVPSVKEIGLGLAVAIALDATIVRLVLVPAAMELMGRWNWWLPGPLARRLPAAGFESSGRADDTAAAVA